MIYFYYCKNVFSLRGDHINIEIESTHVLLHTHIMKSFIPSRKYFIKELETY
jgi:hypothetical protein